MNRIILSLALVFLVAACSTDPDTETSVVVVSGLDANAVTAGAGGIRVAGSEGITKISIKSVRVLVSRMILHPSEKSDADTSGDRVVKTQPFLFVADSSGTKVIVRAALPTGTYSKLKYEIHRFSGSEAEQYAADVAFADFVDDQRYTVIIAGTLVRDGVNEPFTYRSRVNQNVKMLVEPALNVVENSETHLALNFNPASVFLDGSELLDPADKKNESKIDNGIKSAFRARKR